MQVPEELITIMLIINWLTIAEFYWLLLGC